jgi:hypothetical protein
MLRFAWLWSECYKGLEISSGRTVARPKSLWLGWTTRKYKARGW